MSSQSEPEYVQSSSETLKGGFEIGCRSTFWRVVVASTTLGDTMVELQLLYFGSLIAQALGLSRSIESLCLLLWPSHLPHGHTWFSFYQLSQTQSKVQLDHNVSNLGKVV